MEGGGGGGRAAFYWMFIFKNLIFGGHSQMRKLLIPGGHFNKFHESSKKAVRSGN